MKKAPKTTPSRPVEGITRRAFLQHSAGAAVAGGALTASLPIARSAFVAGSDEIRVGLVGCGGRGGGAALQVLKADRGTRLVAVADAFADRLKVGLNALKAQGEEGKRVRVRRQDQYVGFDAYQGVIGSGVDVVLLATPPHFRPMQLKAAIQAGKHVFAEKPVAVDAPGVRSVLATTELARRKGLSIVSGLNSRYSFKLQEAVRRVHQGQLGRIVSLHTVRYGSGVWVRPRKPGMTEMEYQMRNWYYFTWLSGDFNVEQFVHQLDRCAWLMKDQYPVRCYGTGGRIARTGPEYGHIYDHFSTVYEYQDGVRLFATARHQPGCTNQSATYAYGGEGTLTLNRRRQAIEGKAPWTSPAGRETDSHQLEQNAFLAALRKGKIINNGEYMAKSTLMAIMQRMTAYTGVALTWDQAIHSQQALKPSAYRWDAEPPEAKVAIPGITKFA